MRNGALVLDEVADPRPGPGQLHVRVLACGICGSDLHFLRHGRSMVEMTEELVPSLGEMASFGAPRVDLSRDIVMGHEFCAEVIEAGPETSGPRPGTRVVSLPVLVDSGGIHQLAYNNDFPGGYAEQMLLSAPLAIAVPEELDSASAALTEPLAVGIHAVARSEITEREAAVVAGCGPVGLSVVAALGLAGVEVIVASDPSPERRRLAAALGATEVVDPGTESLVEAWRRIDGRRSLVAFEAVGIPGMIQALLRDLPPRSRTVVVGVCMEDDTVRPFFAVAKELDVRFSFAYDPAEFARSLEVISSGAVDVAQMVTGRIGLDGVPEAFEALSRPDEHVKIVVEPA